MAAKNGYRALIVDDEPDIVELLQYNLTKEGFEVRTAENGKRALEVARAFQPNIILLDIMMPVMDGVEACRQLKEIPALKNSFIVFPRKSFLTADAAAKAKAAAPAVLSEVCGHQNTRF